jgi:hypothetical protein
MGRLAIPGVGLFFFSAWLTMIFWGMVSPELRISTISYPTAMLVTIGLWLVMAPLALAIGGRRLRPVGRWREGQGISWSEGSDLANLTAVFSGSATKVTAKGFKGGRVTAVCGGVALDLRGATVEQRPAILDVTAVMGGAEIRVPPDWRVRFETSTVFGGTADERKQVEGPAEGPPHLVIRGTLVFGGVSVKD